MERAVEVSDFNNYLSPNVRASPHNHLFIIFSIPPQTVLFMVGAQVGFFRGDIKTLLNDVQVLQPTVFLTVPRLLNRMYDKV